MSRGKRARACRGLRWSRCNRLVRSRLQGHLVPVIGVMGARPSRFTMRSQGSESGILRRVRRAAPKAEKPTPGLRLGRGKGARRPHKVAVTRQHGSTSPNYIASRLPGPPHLKRIRRHARPDANTRSSGGSAPRDRLPGDFGDSTGPVSRQTPTCPVSRCGTSYSILDHDLDFDDFEIP